MNTQLKIEDNMELKEIVMKLIGPVQPQGESNTDEERLKNLKALCKLTDELVMEIDKVAYNKDRREHSMSEAGKFASNFLTKGLGICE